MEKLIEVEPVFHDSVENVFTSLKSKKKAIGIVSNSMHRTIQLYLKRYNLSEYVDFIFSLDDAGCRKDNDIYWKKLIKKQKLKPSECLMIGDDELEDGQIPLKFGFKTFLIRNSNDLEALP